MKKLSNAAAEQLILGSCMKYPGHIDALVERLAPNDFADERAGRIYAAICRITLSGKAGSVALVEDLREAGELDAVGGDRAITYLESKARKDPETVLEAVQTVVDLSKKRDQVAAAQTVAATIADGGDPSGALAQLTATANETSEGWADLDSVLTSILAGTYRKAEPTLLQRSDGASLLYATGKINWIAAPPESFKSWIAKLTCVQLAEQGLPSVYVDFEESDPGTFTERICSIALGRGHSIDTVRSWLSGETQVLYYRNATAGLDNRARAQVHRIVKQRSVPFVVLDGVAAAMASHSPPLEEDKARDVSLWLAAYVWPLASLGAGVLCVDHTVKNSKEQSSFAARSARGSGHKLAAVSGSMLVCEVKEPGSAWSRGEVWVWIMKDRPGRVRVSLRNGKRLAAILVSTPQAGQVVECTKIELLSPEAAAEQAAEKAWHLIAAEQICKILNGAGKTLSKGEVKDLLDARKRERGGRGWKNDTVAAGFAFLTQHGWVACEREGKFEMLTLIKQYEADMGLVHADEAKGARESDPF